MQITLARSYRCTYRPPSARAGALPAVQVKAGSTDHARRAAAAVTGCAVVTVERVDGKPRTWTT